ncbi:ABC-F family ATP-binding cassette domain-containing protein [Paenibacillus gorillae]|uniref:ABC-F family ATP-binding cassette domain-containing protein n=1 Tax=Paenibacillus gorillae TaxID=1243662 RepID=UPI0004BCCF7A|nr:ABC-F family ATP-binding cassette domain-containing protein [Paenibacillus gorillae]
MSLLIVDQISHMYTDKMIFNGVSFRLNRGEHAGLVGSNGSGKSTLLRLLAGQLIPDKGSVNWLPAIAVGYLQQHADLEPGATMLQLMQGAFSKLYAVEQSMQHIAEQLSTGSGSPESLLAKYGELQQQLELSGFYELDSKIEEVAAGLGLREIGLQRQVDLLSGGQRTKLLLGRLLLEEPDVLLLDEPTNFLDEIHIDWLIGYLKRYENAYIVVSHDERFLQEVTGTIFHLEHGQLKRYGGDYRSFLQVSDQNKQQQLAAYERQSKEVERLEAFIQKNRIRKAKQAKSREKVLGRMEMIDRPASGPQPRFKFRLHSEPVPRIVEAADVQFGYSQPLFSPADFVIHRGDKIAIIGSNGIGKSTLLRTMMGQLPPLQGALSIGERVLPGYYAQEDQPSEETPLDQLCAARPDLTQKDIRSSLAMTGLKEAHIRRPLRSLSGGEQAKVRLCHLMLGRSNFLVLDEPTNHLDIIAKQALADALAAYEGTVLIVSHEPEFYESWATAVWRLEEWS